MSRLSSSSHSLGSGFTSGVQSSDGVASRVVSWAVGFEKLLEDPTGVEYFTVRKLMEDQAGVKYFTVRKLLEDPTWVEYFTVRVLLENLTGVEYIPIRVLLEDPAGFTVNQPTAHTFLWLNSYWHR